MRPTRKSEKLDFLFSRSRMYFIVTACWVYAIFIHAFPTFLPPHMNYVLDGYAAIWDNPYITNYYFVEDISCCSCVFVLVCTCYAAIIIRYRKIRQQFTVLPSSTVAARVRQFRLALQCMIRCFAFFFYDIIYYIIGYLTDGIWLTFICSTYLWAFNNALSPWLYLAFDRQLRATVKAWFYKTDLEKVQQHPVSIFCPLPLRNGNRVEPARLGPYSRSAEQLPAMRSLAII